MLQPVIHSMKLEMLYVATEGKHYESTHIAMTRGLTNLPLSPFSYNLCYKMDKVYNNQSVNHYAYFNYIVNDVHVSH